MGPKLFQCNTFSIYALTKQAEDFAGALSERDWEKFDAAMTYFTRCLLTGAPVLRRAEKVRGSTQKLYELKITAPGSKGPQQRMLCAVEGRCILCVRGIDKRQRRLAVADIEAADKALARRRGGGHESSRKKERAGRS
ncbi:MAG TPA: hypothetical protein VHR18_03580 [Solirubrobacterales bacterium]|jgi:hypothetical protein|nr:hypothetical protein [Solirubrobacterales bacterium]